MSVACGRVARRAARQAGRTAPMPVPSTASSWASRPRTSLVSTPGILVSSGQRLLPAEPGARGQPGGELDVPEVQSATRPRPPGRRCRRYISTRLLVVRDRLPVVGRARRRRSRCCPGCPPRRCGCPTRGAAPAPAGSAAAPRRACRGARRSSRPRSPSRRPPRGRRTRGAAAAPRGRARAPRRTGAAGRAAAPSPCRTCPMLARSPSSVNSSSASRRCSRLVGRSRRAAR